MGREQFDTPRGDIGDVAIIWESPPGIEPVVEFVYTKGRDVFVVELASGALTHLTSWSQLKDFIVNIDTQSDVEILIKRWFEYVDGYRDENPCDAVKYKIINKVVIV